MASIGPMLRTAPRALATLAVLACAGVVATCTTEASGPGRRGTFAVEPILPPALHLNAFNLTVDNVRLIVVRAPSDTVYDQVASFPANQSTLQLSADIPLNTSPESFDVTIEMYSGATLLFSGTQSASIAEGSNSTPAQIPVAYSGPGQNIATLTIDPLDSLLTWDGTLAFRSTALDGQQNPVTSYYLSWTTSDATVPIDATGQVSATHFRKTITVTATTPTNISASTSLTLVPVPSGVTVVSGCAQTAGTGTQLPQPLIVKVVASDNLGVEGVPVTFTPPAGGSVTTPQVVTDVNGVAQTNVTLGTTPGQQQFTISAPGLAAINCNQTAIGPAMHLAFAVQPSNVLQAANITPPVQVVAYDAANQAVTSFTGTVTISIGTNPSGATLSGTLSQAAVAGVATFADLNLDQLGSGFTLVATSPGLTGATSNPFNVTVVPVPHLVFSVQPGNVVAGATIAPAVVVTALDAANNTLTSFTGNVTVAIGTNPGGATLGGTLSVAAVAGVASFNDLTLNNVGSGYTLTASAATLASATSTAFNVTNAGGAHLVFTTQPSNVTAGVVIAPAIVVTAEDAQNNPVTSFTANVTLAFGTCPFGATLSGTPTVAAVAGVATFNDISIDKAGGCTLVTSSQTLQSVVSSSFTIAAAAATKLGFTTQPSNVVAGVIISPVVAVAVQDQFGNTVPSATDNITVAIGTNPGGATLGGLTTKAASSGIVLFSNITLDKIGTGYTLTATATSRTGATSNTFNVTAAAAASVVKISGDNQNGTGGAPLAQPLVVEVRDALANPVSGATVNWATTDGGSFSPASGPTGTNGRAQTNWTLGPSAPSQSATATVGALTPASFSATATIGTPAISLSFSGIPGVGIGLTAKVYVDINQPAPVGGQQIALAVADPTVLTAPASVTILQGKTRDSVIVTGGNAGTTTLTATASGFTDGVLSVQVQNRNISVPTTLNVPYGQTASLPIQLPAPAPAGGVSFTVVSSAPGFVSVASSPVTIAAGGQTVNATLNGILPGPATITVSNPAYVDGVTNATTTASLDITQTSTSLNASFGTSISINFVSNGVPAAAPAPGISVNFTANDPTCVAAQAGVTIPTGLVSTTANLTYGGSATLPCTTKLFANATNLQPDSITVTVNPIPTISVGAVTVGSGLQVNTSFTLAAGNHGNINVQLTSADPGVLLSPDNVTAGQQTISIPVANGVQTVGFYVQGLEGRTTDTIRAVVTVSAPGFSNGTATMTSQQAAIDLQGTSTPTTTLSPSSFVYARTGIANSINSGLNQLQAVRAGAPGPLTVTFATPSNGLGELLKKGTGSNVVQTATIPIGQSNSPTDTTSGGVAFHALLSGTTTVAATIPGYISTAAATRSIDISQPGITVGSVTVGSGLQVNTSFTLGAPNHGAISVTVASSNAAALVSPDAVTPGTSQITIPVADGVTTVGFYVQGLEGQTGTPTITVSASGFTNGTGTATVVQAALDLQGLPTQTTPLTPSSFVYARVGVPNGQLTALNQLQSVRAGAPGALTVTFTTPANGIGELLKKATPAGATQTATIAIGQSNSPTDTTSGGVAFHPMAGLGPTTVSATIPGVVQTAAGSRTITNQTPTILVGSVTVGSGLQINTSFTLGAPNHGNFNVTLSSDNPSILLAPDAVTAGQTSIQIPVADGVQTVGFYVQGLEGVSSAVSGSVTVSATGFSDGVASQTVVQPALDLQGVPSTMAVGAPDAAIYARIGVPNGQLTALNQLQAVRAGSPGGSITVTFTSDNVNAATLVNGGGGTGSPQTALIFTGQSNSPTSGSGGVLLRRVASGVANISAAVTGVITTTAGTRQVTVQ